MNCGWSEYLHDGDKYYVVASGDVGLEKLLLRETSPPLTQNDPMMESIAKGAAQWIMDGKEFETGLNVNATPFQERVYKATCMVPKGKVTTYAAIADHLGCRAYRAVGQALNKNCLPLFIPCHRVIRKDGTLGGFETGTDLKEKILKGEGVGIKDGKVDPSCILRQL